jgi:hypothetical protein
MAAGVLLVCTSRRIDKAVDTLDCEPDRSWFQAV